MSSVFHPDLFDIADAQVRTRESFQDLARTVVGLPVNPQAGVAEVLKQGRYPHPPISKRARPDDDGRPALKHIHHWVRRDIDLADVCVVPGCGKVISFRGESW